MEDYTPDYSEEFEEDVLSLSVQEKRQLYNQIPIILSNPLKDADKKEGSVSPKLWRKHVIRKRYRIFYEIRGGEKKIIFHRLRLKNKKTYK